MRYLIIYIGILLPQLLQGQQVFSRQLNYNQDLPGNMIYSMLQDHNGYIWLGTNAGLVRYDGKTFHKYSAGSKGGSAPGGLGEDASGTIWGKTFSFLSHSAKAAWLTNLFSFDAKPEFCCMAGATRNRNENRHRPAHRSTGNSAVH